MTIKISRRGVLAAAATTPLAAFPATAAPAPKGIVEDRRIISHLTHRYHGWPTVAQRRSGELLLVCSGGRESHVCPFGRVELMRSPDQGETWTWPEVVMDGPIDDRDAGIVETSQGSLLVTTFTSLAYEPVLRRGSDSGNWDPERTARWNAAHHRIDDSARQAALGVWMKRSTDGGVTWSGRYPTQVNSPHGPIQLRDGRLLYAGKTLWQTPSRVGVCQSEDDGQSWSWLAEIPARTDDQSDKYHELHAVETQSGKLIAHIRNHNSVNDRETLQSESDDGGHTWTVPHGIGVWGLPSHLLKLRDGRLVMSYGHRRAPLGAQARISEDEGESWSEPILLSDDGTSGDLGYTSTVELGDGNLLSVWYEKLTASPMAQLRQAVWRLV